MGAKSFRVQNMITLHIPIVDNVLRNPRYRKTVARNQPEKQHHVVDIGLYLPSTSVCRLALIFYPEHRAEKAVCMVGVS